VRREPGRFMKATRELLDDMVENNRLAVRKGQHNAKIYEVVA
jgi:hypothetical protein